MLVVVRSCVMQSHAATVRTCSTAASGQRRVGVNLCGGNRYHQDGQQQE
jgi:hypothetical protein